MPPFDRLKIAGVEFDFTLKDEVMEVLRRWRASGRRSYVAITNPHSVMLCRRDRDMRRATTGAGLTLPDGVGIVVAGKLLGYGRRHRVTGPALMLALCDQGREQGYRHYFYGGAEGVAEHLVRRLVEQFPGLQIAGTYCPPFREVSAVEDEQIMQRINAACPDIVWVGLGAPKQEKWMSERVGRIHATAMIGVGAAFDFHSGNVRWAPTWVRRSGLEWAYRLAMNPKRMWRRNLDSPLFLVHVLAQAAVSRIAGIVRPNRARSGWMPPAQEQFPNHSGLLIDQPAVETEISRYTQRPRHSRGDQAMTTATKNQRVPAMRPLSR